MKRYLNISLAYAVAAMVGGVFYREFTKWNGFTGVTALGKVHVHLFLLGMVMFLLVALFADGQLLPVERATEHRGAVGLFVGILEVNRQENVAVRQIEALRRASTGSAELHLVRHLR